MFELVESVPKNAEIKVVGVGGGGCNAVRHMLDCNMRECILFAQTLTRSLWKKLMELPLYNLEIT